NGKADFFRRGARHPSHFPHRHSRLHGADGVGSSPVGQVKDGISESQTAVPLRRGNMWGKAISTATMLLAATLAVSAQAASGPTPVGLEADQQAYCEYVTQQAQAQRDLLLTPNAIVGFTQPETGLPAQLVWGLSSSLSDIRKAGLTMDAARKNCDLYSATTA